MKTLKERIAVEQALLDGKCVQECLKIESDNRLWTNCEENHVFYWGTCDYRTEISPREFWVNSYRDFAVVHKTEAKALISALGDCEETIKVREVL